MTLKKLLEIYDNVCDRRRELLIGKNHDYANDPDEDALDNFKKTALIFSALTGMDFRPVHSAMFLKILKLVREGNLIFNDKEPVYEPVEGTLDDDENYTDLARAILIEERRLRENEEDSNI